MAFGPPMGMKALFYDRLIPNGLMRDFRRSVIQRYFTNWFMSVSTPCWQRVIVRLAVDSKP